MASVAVKRPEAPSRPAVLKQSTLLPKNWTTLSFTRIGFEYMASSNTLSPTQRPIRVIEDAGSLTASLQKADLDLFEGEVAMPSLLWRGVLAASKIAIACGIALFASPLGTLWHAAHTLYYLALSVIKFEIQAPLPQHLEACSMDLVYSTTFWATALVALAIFSDAGKDMVNLIVETLPITVFGFGLGPLFFPFAIYDIAFRDGATFVCDEHASILRREFGIVAEGGWLLQSDEEDINVKNGNLDGYFYNIAALKAVDLIESLYYLAQELAPHYKIENLRIDIAEPQDCFHHLLKIANRISPQTENLQKALLRAQKAFDHYQSARQLVFTPGFKWQRDFVLNVPGCRLFFDQVDTRYQAFQTFQTFQTWIKPYRDKLSSEGGPSPDYIKIKNEILNARDHYAILGLNADASQKEIEKAFRTRSGKVHPDKALDWEEEAKILQQIQANAHDFLIKKERIKLED